MDVGLPIASVIPSLDGPALDALAGTTRPLTLSQVHQLAGRGSVSGVRRVLLRLEDAGLVLEVPGGYILNRDHLAAPAVETLARLHGELLARIRSAVNEWGGTAALVGMFGSAARRDGDTTSDIDVLIISDDRTVGDFADHLASEIQRWTGNQAQVIAASEAELRRLRREKEPVVEHWERDLVVVSGERLVLGRAA